MLERLARVHLVTEVGRDRYRLHDLLRLYAAERAERDEEPDERERVLRRVLLWYLYSVDNGHRVVLPAFHRVPLPEADLPVGPAVFEGVDQAMDWFERERENLVAAVRVAGENGADDLAWRLPAVMYGFFEMRGYWSQWRDLHLLGVEAAERIGDEHGLACNRLGLGDANWLLKRTDEAFECYRAAAEGAARCGDRWVEGFALRQTAVLLHDQGRYEEASGVAERALAVFERGQEWRGAGMALLTLGDCQRERGFRSRPSAVASGRWSCSAPSTTRGVSRGGRCALGRALADLGRWSEALDRYREALATFRSFGNRRNESRALIGMGEACAALGRTGEAREHLGAAKALLDEIGSEQAADLAERIRGLDVGGG
ncbi:tetratricopeptide repeat protein [Thermobifida fusca]|uniref:tetratricopeptide repeat protein n=1 Tax=Thermobifida fusca TaxID=2021 RepID=UPI0030B7F929